MPQLRLLWQTAQARPCSQRGHSSQARRARSAVGSIGNTITRPFRQHTGADQFVVDALLLLVEIGVEHVVRLVLLGGTAIGSQSSPIASSTAVRRRASSSVKS